MRNFKSFFVILFGLSALAIISSCTKDHEKVDKPQISSIKIEDTNIDALTGNPSQSQLLIVPIPFYNNMFHFPSLASFNAVKSEIGLKMQDYEDYFIWRDLNYSSFDRVNKASNLIHDEMRLV